MQAPGVAQAAEAAPAERGAAEPRLLPLADCPPVAWRNGGGVTRELLVGGPGGHVGGLTQAGTDWSWRLSVADIAADGSFSAYPGVQRWFAVVEGPGVVLAFAGEGIDVLRHLQTADEPLCFDGGAAPQCRLVDGSTRDLNLMLRGVPGTMRRAHAGVAWRPQAAAAGLYLGSSGAAGAVLALGRVWPLAPETLLWFDEAPAELQWQPAGGAPAWWISVGATASAATPAEATPSIAARGVL